MKIATCLIDKQAYLAIIIDEFAYPIPKDHPELPSTIYELLAQGASGFDKLKNIQDQILAGKSEIIPAYHLKEIQLLAPIPRPNSFRDAYAFRQHVETSRANRNLPMIPEFDEFPVFYFSNHLSIQGPGPVYIMPKQFEQLDFELEIAILIHKEGRNIQAKDADNYIAGYMILNDFSARKLQMEEMKLNLGPAKGKDFATAIGPYLVSKDELKPYLIPTKPGHIGDSYALTMTCKVNGIQVSQGNAIDMHWTFAEIIERASYGVTLYPGDLIGSGTVGTGCFLELNGTAIRSNPNAQMQWLQANDLVELEITALGTLKNQVILDIF